MKIIAGIDIGNSSTETALGKVYENNVEFLSSGKFPLQESKERKKI